MYFGVKFEVLDHSRSHNSNLKDPPLTQTFFSLSLYRYGKFAVLDLLNIEDMWPVVEQRFDMVQKSLLQSIMSKELLHEEK